MSGAPVPEELLGALRLTLAFEAQGAPAANLTLGTGRLDGTLLHVALIENRIASGSIGKTEVSALVPMLVAAAREQSPVVLYLDSAGARISEGLEALGAFRRLFREVLAARVAGAPLAVVLGRNCFGGASMLAHLARKRLFAPETRLAMSGPSILARAAGVDALDEMFRAVAQATIGATSRAKSSEANTIWTREARLAEWLREAIAAGHGSWDEWRLRHESLRLRLDKGLTTRQPEALRRRELERLYPEGYATSECDGVITGEASARGGVMPVLGLVGRSHLGAERAWRFADAAWRLAKEPPVRLDVLLDCESHSARLEDEAAVLSEFVVDMGVALAAVAAHGTHVELTVLDRAGGGVYAALAAPAAIVAVVHGADIQVMPGPALASILGTSRDAIADFAEYRRTGVADLEHKLGLPP